MLQKIVKTEKFTSVHDMKDRIAYLEKLKEEQEDIMKFDLIEIYKSLQPAELIKSALDNIREDVEVGEKAGGLVGSLGLNYLVSRLTGRNNSPVGYLKSMVIQQMVNFLYRKNEKAINRFVGNLTKKALRKVHILDEEEPKEIALEEDAEEMDEMEQEEDRKLAMAVSNADEKPEAEPTKNENLKDPTPGPDAEEGSSGKETKRS